MHVYAGRHLPSWFVSFAFTVLLLASCSSGGGGGSSSSSDEPETASGEDLLPELQSDEVVAEDSVNATPEDGGVVTVEGATLTIPPGALSEPAQIGLTVLAITADALPPGDGARLGQTVVSPHAYVITSDKTVDLSGPLMLRVPLDPAKIPAGTDPADVMVSTQAGGYIIPQGAADNVDLDAGFMDLTLRVPELEEGMGSQAIRQPVRGVSTPFLLLAGAFGVGGPLALNAIIATTDEANVLRFQTRSSQHFIIYYNPTLEPALGNILDLERTLNRARELFVEDMGFSLPNAVNLDGRYTIVIDDLKEHSALPRDSNGNVPDGLTFPGSSFFEGASYINVSLPLDKRETTAVHEYFHALEYGALSSPFIVNVGDSRLNRQSQWLFEGAATALSGRVVVGNNVMPARDPGFNNGLQVELSLFDPNQRPATDVAQDFFFFLERRLGGVDFYIEMFEELGPSPLDGRERAVRAADDVLMDFTDGELDMATAWEEFTIDFWIDSRALYPAANIQNRLAVDPDDDVSTSVNLPSLSYSVIEFVVPPLEKDAKGNALPDQAVDLELEFSLTSTEDIDFADLELVDVLGPGAALRESMFATTSGTRSRKFLNFRTEARRRLFVVVSYSKVDSSSRATLRALARLTVPEGPDAIDFLPGFIYVNFDGTTGTNPAAADIQLIGSLAEPTILWGTRRAVAVAVVDNTAVPKGGRPVTVYCISSAEDPETFEEIPIFPPVIYGDYSDSDTEPCSATQIPSPPLRRGRSYQAVVEDFEENISASIIFALD